MKLGIYSHCTIDTIKIGDSSEQQVGGAACYCGIAARQLKFDVELFTKFGKDFPSEYLVQNKIHVINGISEKPTTRFVLDIKGSDRDLFLENSCEEITFVESDADGILISPLFDEISFTTFNKIKENSNFLFLDPQGFLRRKDSSGKIFLEKTDLDLSDVSAIKAGSDEIVSITGESDIEGMKLLHKKGVQHVLYTDKENISLLIDDKLYSLRLPNKKIHDTTGIGDIFSSTFACTMLKEKDFLWAFCFAAGSAQAALDSKELGLAKIPSKGATESNASYFYNTVKFKQV